VWIAFTEHAWSDDTVRLYRSDENLRKRRMQMFEPSKRVGSSDPAILLATQANVEKVIEYQPGFDVNSLIGGMVGTISAVDGTHRADKLKMQTTRYPLHMRLAKDESKIVVEAMNQASTGSPANTPAILVARGLTPIILPLYDTVGITHELNGFSNDAAGWVVQYDKERELELTAMNAIETVKKAMEDKANKRKILINILPKPAAQPRSAETRP
jgi:hypothetical protein